MRFSIQPAILAKAPDIVVGIVVAEGVDNAKPSPRLAAMLAERTAALLPTLSGKVKEDPRVTPYRDAFQRQGINPNKFMCSIESLMTRIQKSGSVPSINPVVDAGNAVSIGRFLPIGAHDLGQAGDEIELRLARPGDCFVPFGQAEAEAVDAGEVVYATGSAVRTRRWMWRQSEIGKIGPGTSRVFFPIDGFAGFNADAVLAARDELARLVETELGGRAVLGLVNKDHPAFSC